MPIAAGVRGLSVFKRRWPVSQFTHQSVSFYAFARANADAASAVWFFLERPNQAVIAKIRDVLHQPFSWA